MAINAIPPPCLSLKQCVGRISDIGFKYIITNPDVWMHISYKLDNKEYYEYIPVYFDGVMCISNDSMIPMKDKATSLIFKKDNIKPSGFYLGAKL